MLFVNLSYASLLGKTNVRQDRQHEMMTYLQINVEAVFSDLCDQGGLVAYVCLEIGCLCQISGQNANERLSKALSQVSGVHSDQESTARPSFELQFYTCPKNFEAFPQLSLVFPGCFILVGPNHQKTEGKV